MELPASLKKIERFTKIADQIEEYDKVVAYYCLAYAIELGIEIMPKDSPEEVNCNAYLSSLLDVLEKKKKFVSHMTRSETVKYLTDFAIKVFDDANNRDSAGQVDRDTARYFLHSSIFLEILKQFGMPDEEVSNRLKYSKFRATEIVSDLKNGKQPSSSVYKDYIEKHVAESINDNIHNECSEQENVGSSAIDNLQFSMPPSSQNNTRVVEQHSINDQSNLHHGNQFEIFLNDKLSDNMTTEVVNGCSNISNNATDTLYISQKVDDRPFASNNTNISNYCSYGNNITLSQVDMIVSATKVTRDAISALQFDDVNTAIKALKEALRILTEGVNCLPELSK